MSDETNEDGGVDERTGVAERAARAGGKRALETFRTGIGTDEKSSKTDLVTQADRDAQERVIDVIRETYPEDAIVGEEGDELKSVPQEGTAWVIDPIDGTNNYVRGIRTWATSVAATIDGDVVTGVNTMPALGDTYVAGRETTTRGDSACSVSERSDPQAAIVSLTAWRGSNRVDAYASLWDDLVHHFGDARRFGSGQAVLSLVASGALEAAVTNDDPSPWDVLAGAHQIRRAGGRVTGLDGTPWEGTGGFVASNGVESIHEELLDAARRVHRATE